MDAARKTIHFHIGQPKTGSSAIQSFLAKNVEWLRERGFDYPENNSFAQARSGRISSGNIGSLEGWTDRADRIASTAEASSILFSGEMLFQRIKPDLDAILDLAQRHDLHFLMFVRNPLDRLFSVYAQAVKRGGLSLSLNEFVTDPERGLAADFRATQYIIDRLRDHDIPISVRNYSIRRDRLIADFMSLLGFDPAEFAAADTPGIVNRSLTRSEMALQRAFNRHYGAKASRFVSDPLVNELPDIASEVDFLSRDAYDIFAKRIAVPVAELNARLPDSDRLVLESYREFAAEQDDAWCFSDAQLDTLARSVSEALAVAHRAGRAEAKRMMPTAPAPARTAPDPRVAELERELTEARQLLHSPGRYLRYTANRLAMRRSSSRS